MSMVLGRKPNASKLVEYPTHEWGKGVQQHPYPLFPSLARFGKVQRFEIGWGLKTFES